MIVSESEARAWVGALAGVDAEAMAKLDELVVMLAAENERQNLVAAATLPHVWVRHIADSAQLLTHVPRETSRWLDLGTGAGFPGLVIAALWPACRVVLVEVRNRRAEWLARAASLLDLDNVTVAACSVEKVNSFVADVISARAFAPLDRLLALSMRFSTSDTRWVLPKGRSAPQELATLAGWQHSFHVEQSLTDPEGGIIVGRLQGRKETAS